MDQKMNDSAGFVVNRDDDNNKNNNGAFRRRARLSNISERDENNEDDGVFRKTCSNRHISLDTHSSVRRTRRRQRTIHKLLPVLLLVLLETQFSDSFSSRHDATARSRYRRVHPFNQFTKLRSAIMDEPTEKMYTSIQDVYLETYSDLDDQYSPDSREPLNSAYQYWELSLQSFNMDLYNLAHSDPAKAEDAVEVMLEMGLQNHNYPRPDSSSYTTVMDGYIRSGQLQEAQSVLDKMDVLAESDKTYSPTEFTYMLMAQAWANDWKDDFTGKSAEKAEAVLRRMQEKTITAETDEQSQISEGGMVKVWSIVVEAWCKRAGIARQAMQSASDLLNEMESYDTALVRPNVLTYTSYITGLSKCKDNHMARKAEATLERMTRHHVQPDMVAYTAVLNCWAKAVSRREREVAAVRALRLLGDMERLYIQKHVYSVKPSHITYATAIAAIGNSLDPEAPRLAEEILQRMDKLHKSDQIANLRPVTSTYNAVLYALSKAPSNSRQRYARRAEELLVEMNLRAEHGEKAVQPDVRTWAAVLRAWAHSRVPDAAENSQRVLDMMEDLYQRKLSPVHPNFVCFTT
jgi:pentatricopeptide repeat protein